MPLPVNKGGGDTRHAQPMCVKVPRTCEELRSGGLRVGKKTAGLRGWQEAEFLHAGTEGIPADSQEARRPDLVALRGL